MYESYFPKVNSNIIGYAAISDKDKNLVGLAYPAYNKYIGANKSQRVGIYTGRYIVYSDKTYYQIQFEALLKEASGQVHQFGFVDDATFSAIKNTVVPKPTTSDLAACQNYLDSTIDYNKKILENNLISSRIINHCTENGIVVPTSTRTGLYTLQKRLNQRDDKIKKTAESVQDGESPNFSIYNDALIDFMSSIGIGVIPLIYVIVIAAIAVAATASSAILIYKSLHTEAKTDFGYSSDLTAQLVKYLPPETYKLLMDENAANAKKAQDAIDAASGKSLINTLKYVGIGLASVWAFDRFMQNRNK